ncbi:XRE family transcriptional regulator [Paenibacillus sp. MER 180]|uniref:helix-turn-helix domain-containing protein n=1 Tax=unclassified Paenibacillus TaxID=185978 RepID=UPI00080652D1|nr:MULTISPECIES: XRE family transcriptional regulator [unclassified Paenibacillus]MCM3290836.1 XRE family transcriptional regulator [Paenibacillus sp. MER 180]OBY79119.1 DNA-binding protein [Paenibacillus sp. KS1]
MNEHETKQLMQSVGANLRKLRKEKQLSLEELSALSGVSKLTLGNIERGDTNPTIGMMWKISRHLSVPLMTLLMPDKSVRISRSGHGPTYESESGQWILEPVFTDLREKMEMLRARLKPNCVYEPEPNHPWTVEIATVMSGTVELTIGEDTYTLHQFDSIQFSATETHMYANVGDEEAVVQFTVFYS